MNMLVFALLAGAIGLAISGGELSGGLAGAFAGLLAGWVSGLSTRIERLERQIAALVARTERGADVCGHARRNGARRRGSEGPPRRTVRRRRGPPADRNASLRRPRPESSSRGPRRAARSGPSGERPHPRGRDRPPLKRRREPKRVRAIRAASSSSLRCLDDGFAFIKRWFTTGNVPVKVGVVLSVFGVGFLVKEGVDRQWLVLPLELRLMFVALFGIALLVLGWRLRHKERTYALSVQGGGIAVLYLTIYASFGLFHLLPSAAAFALLLVVTVAAGTLAVLQDSRSLAVLGIVGGFMAPVLVSNDSGNHVALFSYYAIFNVAIVGIAWFKAWRELNVLGFLFTFGIGSLWGSQSTRPRTSRAPSRS